MATPSPILAVFEKEMKSEFLTRHNISAVFLFIAVTITIIALATTGRKVTEPVMAALMWIVYFFAAMTGIAKSFTSEEERGTMLLLRMYASPTHVFFGKLLYNASLTVVLNLFATLLIILLQDSIAVRTPSVFWLNLFSGSLAIASTGTIISALIAKANSKSALFPVLSFPLMLPVIILGLDNMRLALEGWEFSDAVENFNLLVAYTGVITSASYLLFDFIWAE